MSAAKSNIDCYLFALQNDMKNFMWLKINIQSHSSAQVNDTEHITCCVVVNDELVIAKRKPDHLLSVAFHCHTLVTVYEVDSY